MCSDTVNQTNHRCEFCQRSFVRPSTLAAHMCEQRRRHSERGERGVQIGFQAFLAFYQSMHGSSRLKTLDDFDTSPYYRAFVRFGRYCVDTRVIDPESYMRWLLARNRKIDHWASDREYTEFLADWLPQEPMASALRRGQAWAQDWAQRNQAPAHDCLRYGNTHALCHAVTTGYLSAWLVYNCDSGRQWLTTLTPTDLAMIWPYIDSDRWQRCFHDHPADQALCEHSLQGLGW
jgi:hypothetical protein